MNKFTFDQKIAESLQNLEEAYDPTSWEALRQKLDDKADAPMTGPHLEKNSELFDKQLRTALQELEVPYQYSHWNKMARQLTQNATIQRIRLIKVAEAAIILLFAANFNNILHNNVYPFKMPVNDLPINKEIPMAKAEKFLKSKTTHSLNASNTSLFESSSYSINSVATISNEIPDPSHTPLLFPIQTDLSQPNPVNNGPSKLIPLALLQTLGFQLTNPDNQLTNIPRVATPYLKRKSTAKQLQLIAYSGIQRLNLHTQNGFSTSTTTPLVGMAVAAKKAKWGLELGASYSQLTLKTDTDVFELYQQGDQTFGISTDQVKASMVSIPVKATRQITRWGKNSLHATVGGTAQIASSKSFTYRHIPYPTPPQGSSLPGNPTLPSVAGLLDNGQLKDNFFASVDAGIRFQRQLSPRLIAYAEPIYRRQIAGKGFGPEASTTNSTTLQAGLITTL